MSVDECGQQFWMDGWAICRMASPYRLGILMEYLAVDILIGFLIGLSYLPAIVIVASALMKLRAPGVAMGVAMVGLLAGPAVWALTFVYLGLGAGLVAFGGWVLGLGLAALIIVLEVVARVRSNRTRSHSAFGR